MEYLCSWSEFDVFFYYRSCGYFLANLFADTEEFRRDGYMFHVCERKGQIHR